MTLKGGNSSRHISIEYNPGCLYKGTFGLIMNRNVASDIRVEMW
jgi:hypothetical protein